MCLKSSTWSSFSKCVLRQPEHIDGKARFQSDSNKFKETSSKLSEQSRHLCHYIITCEVSYFAFRYTVIYWKQYEDLQIYMFWTIHIFSQENVVRVNVFKIFNFIPNFKKKMLMLINATFLFRYWDRHLPLPAPFLTFVHKETVWWQARGDNLFVTSGVQHPIKWHNLESGIGNRIWREK